MFRLTRKSKLIIITTFIIVLALKFYRIFDDINIKQRIAQITVTHSTTMKDLITDAQTIMSIAGAKILEIRNTNRFQEKTKNNSLGKQEIVTTADTLSDEIIKTHFSNKYPGLKVLSEETFDEISFSFPNCRLNPFRIHSDDIPLSELTLLFDPLDATTEYTLKLLDQVSIMMCIYRCGKPYVGIIYFPYSNENYWAWNGHGVSKNIEVPEDEDRKSFVHPKVVVSRSHFTENGESQLQEYFKNYTLVPLGGSGNKARWIFNSHADVYFHPAPIKVWDICAPSIIFEQIGFPIETLDGKSMLQLISEQVVINDGFIASMSHLKKEVEKKQPES